MVVCAWSDALALVAIQTATFTWIHELAKLIRPIQAGHCRFRRNQAVFVTAQGGAFSFFVCEYPQVW
jgi:hypothetical protein